MICPGARRHMRQELAHLARRLAERGAVARIVGDDGDRAILNEVQELDNAARARMLAQVRALTDALARIEAGTYGRCELCMKPVGAARLGVLPAAPFCVACADALEKDLQQRPAASVRDEEEC